MLTFGTVGETGSVVGFKEEVVGTCAGRFSTRRKETEMRTCTIVNGTGIVVRQLSQWMVDVDVIRSMGCVPQDLEILSCEFVRSQECFYVPISPIEPVIEDGESEDMRDRGTGKDLVSVLSIEVTVFYVVEMCISPEDSVTEIVDGHCIWPDEFVLIGDNSCHI